MHIPSRISSQVNLSKKVNSAFEYHWLSRLIHLPGCSCTQHFNKLQEGFLLSKIAGKDVFLFDDMYQKLFGSLWLCLLLEKLMKLSRLMSSVSSDLIIEKRKLKDEIPKQERKEREGVA